MKITRTSVVSGVTRTMDLPITEEQYSAWQNGDLIQNAMPHLSVEQREFILSGTTQEEWDGMYGKEW